MWEASAALLLAAATGALGYTVDVVVPPAPEYGTDVVLEANLRPSSGERVDELTWTKDGRVLMTYRETTDRISWRRVPGVNIDRKESTPFRMVLLDVDDAASGTYGIQMTIGSGTAGSSSVSQYSTTQDMVVGGSTADPLDTRFNSNRRRPGASVGGSSTTFTSQTTSSSSSSEGANPLGNRFNNRRPGGTGGGTTTTFTSQTSQVGGTVPVIPPINIPPINIPPINMPPINIPPVPAMGEDQLGTRFNNRRPAAAGAPAGGASAAAPAPGLQGAIDTLQNVQAQLQNAINNIAG